MGFHLRMGTDGETTKAETRRGIFNREIGEQRRGYSTAKNAENAKTVGRMRSFMDRRRRGHEALIKSPLER